MLGAVEDASLMAYAAVTSGVQGDNESAADFRQELCDQLSTCEDLAREQQPLSRELGALWVAVLDCRGGEGGSAAGPVVLDKEDVEEVVLAHLLVLPEFLARSLVRRLVQQISLGQSLLFLPGAAAAAGEGRLDMKVLARSLEPHASVLDALAARTAQECCSHLMERSEILATKLLRTLDRDGDGVVSETDFIAALPHGLALDVENAAISAAIPVLLGVDEFADIFHVAMAAALGISGVDDEGKEDEERQG